MSRISSAMKRFGLVMFCLSLAPLSAHGLSDPLDGTWKINDKKSSWSDGKFPPTMSLMIQVKIEGNSMKYHSVNDTAKGKPAAIADFEALMDGKPHPFRDSTRFNLVQIRRLDTGGLELLEMKDADVIVGAWWWVSADGKQLIRRGIGKAADGTSHEYEEYFDKQ